MANRVYVSNYAGHDYEAAEKFGEVRAITMGFVDFSSLDRVKYQVAQGIIDSSPDDYLALSGTNIVNAFAAMLWITLHGKVKMLNFNKENGVYREVIVTADSLAKLLETLKVEANKV